MILKIKQFWDFVQELLDVRGDVIMLVFTSAVIYKLLHQGLNVADASVYSAAVTCFAWSNKTPPGPPKGA